MKEETVSQIWMKTITGSHAWRGETLAR